MSVLKAARPAGDERQAIRQPMQEQAAPAASTIINMRQDARIQARRKEMMDNGPYARQMKARMAVTENATPAATPQRVAQYAASQGAVQCFEFQDTHEGNPVGATAVAQMNAKPEGGAPLPATDAGSGQVAQLAYDEVVAAEAEAAAKYTFEAYKDAATTEGEKISTLSGMPGYTKQQKALRLPHETARDKATTTRNLSFGQLDKWHEIGAKKKLTKEVVDGKAKSSWDKGAVPFKAVIDGAVAVESEEASSAYGSVVDKDSIALGKEADTQTAAKDDETVAGLQSTAWGWGVNLAFVEAAVDYGKEINLVTAIPDAAKTILAPGNETAFTEFVVSSHTTDAPWRSLWQGLVGRPTWYTYELDYLKRRGYSLSGTRMEPPDTLTDHDAGDEGAAIGHAVPYTYSNAYKV